MSDLDPGLVVRVLELRRAGVGFAGIAERLELADAAAARAAYDQAMTADDLRFSAELEASRLDRIHTAVWPKAAKGDLNAVDRVVRISERREKLLAPPKENLHELRSSFDASVATSAKLQPVDEALVVAGRILADRIDAAVTYDSGAEATKALWLVPQLVSLLKEMLATPAARLAAEKPEPAAAAPVTNLAKLRAVTARSAG